MIPEESPLRSNKLFDWYILCIAWLISLMVGGFIMKVLLPQIGIAELGDAISNIGPNSSVEEISAMRIVQMLGQIFMFLLPGVLFVLILYRKQPFKYLNLNRWPGLINLFLGIVLILASLPVVQYLNTLLPIPEHLMQMDEKYRESLEALLKMENTRTLLANLIVVALIPAVSEELLFRGIIMKIMGKMGMEIHLVIWVVASIFSAMHFEFSLFLPRLFMGAFLGYLLYWTGNLLVPIVAHFAVNCSQILAHYYYQSGKIDVDIEGMETFPIGAIIISAIVLVGAIIIISRINKDRRLSYETGMEENIQ